MTLATEARISEELLMVMALFVLTAFVYPKKHDQTYRYERQLACIAAMAAAFQFLIFAIVHLIGNPSPKSALLIVLVSAVIGGLSYPHDNTQDDEYTIEVRRLISQVMAIIAVAAWVMFTYGMMPKK